MKAPVPCVLTVLLSSLVACAAHAPPKAHQTSALLVSARTNPHVAACVATEIATAATTEANAWERVRIQVLNRSISSDERARDLAHASALANLSSSLDPSSSTASILPLSPSRQVVENDRRLRGIVETMEAGQSASGEDRKGILVATSAAVASEYAELARAHERAFLLALKGAGSRPIRNTSGRLANPTLSSPGLQAFYALQFRLGYGNPSPRCRARVAS
ncbi:MAG: hypothetical protein H0W30_07710 [Gemmatimonadaceae bacterium]|nr:hypothetical protein [Gemmatimonadaceae bacterium]